MNVHEIVGWLDRDHVAARRERTYRKNLRRLTPAQRRFVRALRHVVESVPGPEPEQREKIMKALRIGLRMYQKLLAAVRKTLG